MSIRKINEQVIHRLSKGDMKAFSLIYECYYTYLTTITLCYVYDTNVANEIVNDVFISIWEKRSTLNFPIHGYLIKTVKNKCLNQIRAEKAQLRAIDEHKKQLLDFQEEYLNSNITPLQYTESRDIELQIRSNVAQLPEKCRIIFEKYFFEGDKPDTIAEDLSINVNTVRVQIKNALARLRVSLADLLTVTIIILFNH